MKQEMDSHLNIPERITLRYEEWLEIEEPSFYAQLNRPTELQWREIETIASLSPYLNALALIRVKKDQLYKLNGRQRLQLWTSGALKKPEFITADLYDLTQDEFKILSTKLYTQQLENLPPHELVISLYKEMGLTFSSDRLNKGFITEAINIALRGKPRAQQDKRSVREKQDINIKKAINTLKDELSALDGLNLNSELFLSGVLAAALIMVVIDKNNIKFFQHLNKLEGQVSSDGLLDPIEALLRVIDSYKSKRVAQVRMQLELCGKTIKAILLWNQGIESPKYWTKNVLRFTDYQSYIREMKRIKGIHEARDL